MKSERRHELQHNLLADWLVKTAGSLRPYQNMVLSAILLVVVLLLIHTWWSRSTTESNERAWDALNQAMQSGNPGVLTKVIEDFKGTSVADRAAAILGDEHRSRGCAELFTDKAAAQQNLTHAIEQYNSVLENSRLPVLRERATFGLALAKESKGDATSIDEAVKLYDEVARTWPDGAFAAAAAQRRDDLKKPATKEFYDRFAHFDPKPVASGNLGPKLPGDLGTVPSEPDLLRSPKLEDKPKDQAKPEEKPADGAKAAGENKPAEAGKPAEGKPAEAAKPADETKPSEQKPPPEGPGK